MLFLRVKTPSRFHNSPTFASLRPSGSSSSTPFPLRFFHHSLPFSDAPPRRPTLHAMASSTPGTNPAEGAPAASTAPISSLQPDVQSAATRLPSSSPPHAVSEVYQYERWRGVTWGPPIAVLDRPAWGDAHGNEIKLEAAGLPTPSSSEWEVEVNAATDDDGWQYATVFKHLEYKRPGGRASQRFGDTVRRRQWRQRDRAVLGVAAEPPASSAAAAAAKQREEEAKKKAIRAFVGMILDLVSRRAVWTLLPWDPSALYFVYQAHQTVYAKLKEQASERRLFGADSECQPPSLLHGERGTLLQDLLCAAVHSRSSYGFAMQAGHMASVAAYIRLQTLEPLRFNAVAGASVEANNEAVAALAGVDVEDILVSHWRASPFRPAHYVAIDRANGCVVVAIRGSLEVGDLLSDLSAHPMEVTMNGVAGWVHPGILAAATYVHCTTEAALQEAAQRCPGWPVLLTGHSLGGGVAALLSLLLKERGGVQGLGNVKTVTVGTAAVASATLAAACQDDVISIVMGSDIIPHLSYASVEHLLVEMSEASPVRQAAEGIRSRLSQVLTTLASVGDTIASTAEGMGGSGEALEEEIEEEDAGNAEAAAGAEESRGGGRASAWHSLKSASFKAAADTQTWRSLKKAASDAAKGSAKMGRGLAGTLRSFNGEDDGAAKMVPVVDLSDAGMQKEAETLERLRREKRQRGALASHPVSTAAALEEEEEEESGGNAAFESGNAGETVVLTYGVLESDSGLAAAAVAQQQAAQDAAAAQPTEDQQQLQDAPGNPEHLYPPGRILWVFPADEDLSSLAENGGNNGAGENGGGRGGEGEEKVDASMSQEVESWWDAAWEGAPLPQKLRNTREEGAEYEIIGEGCCSGMTDTCAPNEGEGDGKVDMVEAAADAQAAGPAEAAAAKAAAAKTAPLVVEAERTAFERLLIMPDCLNDHLPHRYLEALEQL